MVASQLLTSTQRDLYFTLHNVNAARWLVDSLRWLADFSSLYACCSLIGWLADFSLPRLLCMVVVAGVVVAGVVVAGVIVAGVVVAGVVVAGVVVAGVVFPLSRADCASSLAH